MHSSIASCTPIQDPIDPEETYRHSRATPSFLAVKHQLPGVAVSILFLRDGNPCLRYHLLSISHAVPSIIATEPSSTAVASLRPFILRWLICPVTLRHLTGLRYPGIAIARAVPAVLHLLRHRRAIPAAILPHILIPLCNCRHLFTRPWSPACSDAAAQNGQK